MTLNAAPVDHPPVVDTFVAVPNPGTVGDILRLLATAHDPDAASSDSVTALRFYEDYNDDRYASPDERLYTDLNPVDGWAFDLNTTGHVSGTIALLAVAYDSDFTASDPRPLTVTLVPVAAEIVGYHIFYNNSALDGNTPGASSQDDNAIAMGKQALLPGGTSSGVNCTAYSKGLNGIMVDIDGLANPGGLTLANIGNYFGFKVGTSGDPSGWAGAPVPVTVSVRAGAGVGGSDRVTIIWADNAIQKQWLQVTVKSGAATGLPDDEVFYFGNMPGDATGDGVTNGFDLLRVRQNYLLPPGGGRDGTADVTMDGNVNAFDLLAVRQNYLQSLPMISTPAAPTGGMAITLAGFEETAEPLAVQPVTTQVAPIVEQVQVTAVPMATGTAAAISASFSRPVLVATAALEIVNPVGLKVELPTFRYEPVTRTASWTTTGLADGLYQGVIRSSGVLSDGVSMVRDSLEFSLFRPGRAREPWRQRASSGKI